MIRCTKSCDLFAFKNATEGTLANLGSSDERASGFPKAPLFHSQVPDLPPPSRDQTGKGYIVDSSLRIKGLFNYLFVRGFRPDCGPIGSSGSQRGCGIAGPHIGVRWPSRLEATASSIRVIGRARRLCRGWSHHEGGRCTGGMPWMWTLTFGHHEDRTPTHGYEATREPAMAAFAKSWRRE